MAGADDRWAASVVLGDGETAFVRPIRPGDAPTLAAFHERQPDEHRYRRYFSAKPRLTDEELHRFTNVDFVDRVALVLELHGEFVAWASYERWRGRDDADVAFMVDAAHQGKGIATLLLEHLAAIAETNGLARFTADVLADNRAMLSVFARAGWPVRRHFDSGVVELDFPVGANAEYVETVSQREQRADSRAMARLLLPRSVAVIGASDRPGTVGAELWRSVVRGAAIPRYPVNHRRSSVGGERAYATVTDIADDVWLAVVAVPPTALEKVVDDCLAKGVRGAVLVTAVGPDDGVDVPAMVERGRRNGMRIVGPASMGLAAGRVPGGDGVQAMLAPLDLPPGTVAVSMQSGTLGASLLGLARRLSLGLSWFVSLGDKADVSGNDLLQFWEDDTTTSVITMYTETLGNPRKFARIARRVSRRRPIVTVRTGAAAAGWASDALYEQAGVIEVPTVRAMLDTARALAGQPVPPGPRVAVLTNSHSPGVLAESALATNGLTVVAPPLSLDWRATATDYERAVAAALADPGVDAVVVIHAPPVLSAPTPGAEIDAAAAGQPKPVVAVLLGHDDGPVTPGSMVPSYSFPEPAAEVLGRMYRYSRWRRTQAETEGDDPGQADLTAARALVGGAVERGATTLSWEEAERLLRVVGVGVASGLEVDPPEPLAVVAAATRLGFPVAVKSTRRGVGRSAEAGIALDLPDADAVRDALTVILAEPTRAASPVLVQAMSHPGLEVRVHCTTDERMGPVLSVGLGGAHAEAIGDREGRLPPISMTAARELVAATRAGRALAGARIPVESLADLIVHLGQLVTAVPEVVELDANPVMVGADGCTVVDVAVRVARAERHPVALRRLP